MGSTVITAALSAQKKLTRELRRYRRALRRYPLERKAIALGATASALGEGLINIPEDEGYVRFSAARLVGGASLFQRLSDLCKAWMAEPSRVDTEKKPFLINLMKGEDLFENEDVIRLALHDEIIASVARYFGQMPRLFNLNMWWSPPNEAVIGDGQSYFQGSQSYHYDHRDSRQAKVFININDVTEDSGPLHFLTAKDCLKVNHKVGYSQERYTDEQVYGSVPESNVVVASGEAGTAYIVDTARCLHYGSRSNKTDRLILMASFARVNSVAPGGGCQTLDSVRKRLAQKLYANDPVRTFALTAPK